MSKRKILDIDEAISLYRDKKLPTTTVSKIIGCSVQTLITRLREKGVTIRTNGNHMEKCDFKTLKYEYEILILSTSEIARKHDMSSSSVWERLVKNGVKMRDRKEEATKANTKIPVLEHETICKRYLLNQSESCADISADYGVHKTTIADILKANGVMPEHCGARIKSYKGGITPLHIRIRNCEKSQMWKRACMTRDDYTCQETGLRGGKLEVHHLRHFTAIFEEFMSLNSNLNPEKDCDILFDLSQQYGPFWDIFNGKTLSEKAHHSLHTS